MYDASSKPISEVAELTAAVKTISLPVKQIAVPSAQKRKFVEISESKPKIDLNFGLDSDEED
jgi:hypothetical protein